MSANTTRSASAFLKCRAFGVETKVFLLRFDGTKRLLFDWKNGRLDKAGGDYGELGAEKILALNRPRFRETRAQGALVFNGSIASRTLCSSDQSAELPALDHCCRGPVVSAYRKAGRAGTQVRQLRRSSHSRSLLPFALM